MKKILIPVGVLVLLLLGAYWLWPGGKEQLEAWMNGLPKVVVEKEQIVFSEPIRFEKGTDTLLEESFPLLEAIANTIRNHPEIERIRIEGHASAEGSKAYNLRLSQLRAQSVMAHLVEQQGVDASRLLAKGYGESEPRVAKDNKEGRAENRRVEFHILSRKP